MQVDYFAPLVPTSSAKTIAEKLWKICDRNGSGYIEREEVVNMFNQLNRVISPVQVSERTIASYERILDADMNGKITQSDFETLVLRYYCGSGSYQGSISTGDGVAALSAGRTSSTSTTTTRYTTGTSGNLSSYTTPALGTTTTTTTTTTRVSSNQSTQPNLVQSMTVPLPPITTQTIHLPPIVRMSPSGPSGSVSGMGGMGAYDGQQQASQSYSTVQSSQGYQGYSSSYSPQMQMPPLLDAGTTVQRSSLKDYLDHNPSPAGPSSYSTTVTRTSNTGGISGSPQYLAPGMQPSMVSTTSGQTGDYYQAGTSTTPRGGVNSYEASKSTQYYVDPIHPGTTTTTTTTTSKSYYSSSNAVGGPTPMATNSGNSQVEQVKLLFDRYDPQMTGHIATRDVDKIIKETYQIMKLGFEPSAEDITSYQNMLDYDKTGKVSKQDFEDLIVRSLIHTG